MAINLHYGPPGTYKTSGAILDDLPKALKGGRVLITNVRGLDDASKLKEAYKKQKKFFKSLYSVSEEFTVIHFDTRKVEDKEKLRRFFHWAPQDAYFIIDEINTIFKKEWRTKDLDRFNLHSGKPEELTNPNNFLTDRNGNAVFDVDNNHIIRPQNLTEALEMHRHYNWDFSLTSPSYKKFHPVFHDVAEVAFKHINRAVIGVGGSYWEYMHLATNTGNSKADILQQRVRKIPQFIFKLYGSTATGEVRDSSAGRNIFLQPKIFLVLFLIIGMFSYAIYELNRLEMFGETNNEKNVNEAIAPNDTPYQKGTTPNNISSGGRLIKTSATNVVSPTYSNDYLESFEIHLAGILMGKRLITLKREDKQRQTDIRLLVDLGYSFRFLDDCTAIIKHPEYRTRFIQCELHNQDTDYSLLSNGEAIKPVPASKKDAPLIKNPFKSPEN